MSFKKTLVFAIALAAIVFYIRSYELPQQEAEEKKDKIFKDLSAEEVATVTVHRGSENFTLINSNPHAPKPQDIENEVEDSSDELSGKKEEPLTWKLQDAPAAMLDPGRVSSLMSSIASLTSTQTIAAPDVESDKKTYGLDVPEVELTVSGKGETKTLRFGKQNEFLGKRYLEIQGDPQLYLVSESLFEASNKSKNDFRDKTPVTFTDDSVQSLSIVKDKTSIELVRGDKPQWKMTQPIPATGSSFAVYHIFRNLRNLQVENYIDAPGDIASYGLNAPVMTIGLKGKDLDTKVSFGVKGDKKYFQLNGAGSVYETKVDLDQSFLSEPNLLREAQLFRFDTYFAQKIVIEPKGGKKLELVKDKESWKLGDKEADAPFVRQYLKTLSDTKADTFPSKDGEASFTSPELKVTVTIKGEDDKLTEEALIIGQKRGERYAAMVNGSNEPFYISLDTFKDLHISEELLLSHPAHDS